MIAGSNPSPSAPGSASSSASLNGRSLDPEILNGLEVLIIEDTPENQFMFRVFLELYGADVSLAAGGLEGINQALSYDFDVILCDIQMPNVDGYEVVKVLRTHGIKIPILAITAFALPEVQAKALGSGFDGFLTKPIERKRLVQAISDARQIQGKLNKNPGAQTED